MQCYVWKTGLQSKVLIHVVWLLTLALALIFNLRNPNDIPAD